MTTTFTSDTQGAVDHHQVEFDLTEAEISFFSVIFDEELNLSPDGSLSAVAQSAWSAGPAAAVCSFLRHPD